MLSFKIFYIPNDRKLYSIGNGIGINNLITTLKKSFPKEFKEEIRNVDDLSDEEKKEVLIILESEFKS